MRQSAFLSEVDKMRKTEYNNGCYHMLLYYGIYEIKKSIHTSKLACAQVCGLSKKGDYDGEKRNGNKTDDIGCGI